MSAVNAVGGEDLGGKGVCGLEDAVVGKVSVKDAVGTEAVGWIDVGAGKVLAEGRLASETFVRKVSAKRQRWR